jgi:hypothetical protein
MTDIEKKRIKQQNDYVIRGLMTGDPLVAIPTAATFFPPRPIIKKDKDALNFGEKPRARLQVVPSSP